jgi:hypothetical protein
MNLLTVGDSFTYGEELDDLNNAWPHVLGKIIGYNVTNLGEPGTGNTGMVRKVMYNYQDADLIIIAWSHFARLEFADEWGTYDMWPGYTDRWHHSDVAFREAFSDYFTKHHNDTYMYNQYLNNIVLLQHFLKSNNKKFLMVEAFANVNVRELGNQKMHELVDSASFIGWPNDAMIGWVYPCKQGPRGHFLDEGHKKVAGKIYEHIRNIGWVA